MAATDSVECPECGEQFNPAAAGGWCTNPDCGEYRHETSEDSHDEPTEEGKEIQGQPAHASESAQTGDTDQHDSHKQQDDTPEQTGGHAVQHQDQKDEPTSDSGQQDEGVTCPECNKQVPDRNFCLNCGADLSSGDEEDGGQGDSTPPQTGDDLSADDSESVHETSQSTPQDPEETSTANQPEDSATPNGAETTAGDAEPQRDSHQQTASDTVIIKVESDRIRADDGATLGSEIRSAYADAGGDSTEAQYISREHIRIVYQSGQFHVEDISTNGTKVNDKRLEEGDPYPIEEGDTLNFAGVTEGIIALER